MNFNNDGDKILTGAFDGTAIVIFKVKVRFGIPEPESQSICYKDTPVKYQALNFSLVDIFAQHLQLIKPADFGMLELESACLFCEAIMTKF